MEGNFMGYEGSTLYQRFSKGNLRECNDIFSPDSFHVFSARRSSFHPSDLTKRSSDGSVLSWRLDRRYDSMLTPRNVSHKASKVKALVKYERTRRTNGRRAERRLEASRLSGGITVLPVHQFSGFTRPSRLLDHRYLGQDLSFTATSFNDFSTCLLLSILLSLALVGPERERNQRGNPIQIQRVAREHESNFGIFHISKRHRIDFIIEILN